jgi:hypothetical protein
LSMRTAITTIPNISTNNSNTLIARNLSMPIGGQSASKNLSDHSTAS